MLNSIEDGARALLEDAVTVLSDYPEVSYIVIGGWCPVIKNNTDIRHPGTLDVDLLFRESYRSGAIEEVVEGFRVAGFVPSAKHPFQLLRTQVIKNTKFVFNIDLLHPNMANEKSAADMFVDHLDLDVPFNNEGEELKSVQSIVLPNSKVLFSENMFTIESIGSIEYNLISFEGMFVTKMDSCQKLKRERDSFDIYLGFLGRNIDMEIINALAANDKYIGNSLKRFKRYIKKNRDQFNNNVKMYSHEYDGSPASIILEQLNR